MGTTIDKSTFKKLLKQISGKLTDEDGELFPEAIINGKGALWCYDPTTRLMVRVARGIKIYILYDKPDKLGRYLASTTNGEIILVSEEDIYMTGFD